jgi:hypothetical protein
MRRTKLKIAPKEPPISLETNIRDFNLTMQN